MTDVLWPKMRLKHLVEPVQNGVWGDEPQGGEDDVFCVRVADFDRQRFGLKPVATVRAVSKKDLEARLLREGDILLEKSGGTAANPVGFTVMFNGNFPAVSSNFIGRVRMREGQAPRFWLYALAASYFTLRTQKCVRQTTGIQNLDQAAFLDEVFPVPPTEEQRAIADYLDRETARIDTLIEEQQRLIEMLRERRMVLVQHLLTNGANPHAELAESGIPWLEGGVIPRGWEVSKVKYVTGEMRAGEAITSAYIEEAGSYAVFGGNGKRGYTESFTHSGTYVLIGRQGALCGNVHLVHGDFWISEHAIVVPPRVGVHAGWLAYMLRFMDLGQYSMTSAQPGIGVGQIERLLLPVPPEAEQRRIAAHLDAETAKIDNLIAETERFIELSRERRAALITAAVTGQIDVRKAA